MRRPRWFFVVALVVALLSARVVAQEPTPKGAFKTVHLVTLAAADVPAVLAVWLVSAQDRCRYREPFR